MNGFDHVECAITRDVLLGKRNSNSAIMRAAYHSDNCQSQDYKCQLLDDSVFSAREDAIVKMWLALNDRENLVALVEMRRFWSL
jgi:hypothetical protein